MSQTRAAEEPFEIRRTGDRGLGCFATRDIKPGEVILTTYTALHYIEHYDWCQRVEGMIDRYETADEDDRQGWDALHVSYDTDFTDYTEESLRKQRPDGSYFEAEEQMKYLRVVLSAFANAFGTDKDYESAVFLEASRFNHSCDPNCEYSVFGGSYRWVGTAKRDIAKGEEILIDYIPGHTVRIQRIDGLLGTWGFRCSCPKCVRGTDTYTASLIRARNAAASSGRQRRNPYPNFVDNFDEEQHRVKLRADLLREIVAAQGDTEDPARRAELTYALYDAASFYRQYSDNKKFDDSDDGDDDSEANRARRQAKIVREAKNQLLDLKYCTEALRWAQQVWPETHEMVYTISKDVRNLNYDKEKIEEIIKQNKGRPLCNHTWK
ncbi:hypothetical protein F4678DRAFT_456276 [Xylaria arbuscula]|nr:hypothetical protein F4678DRAFT_456276 [Xylaria arbuscula]